MEQVDVLILGAGIAGLGAALKCREIGREAKIFEASGSTGGLLDNFLVNGFRFDNAVHLSFASEEKVREIFDKTPFLTHPADAWCFDDGNWLKHPVQNNLYPLPADKKVDLIKSFISRPEEKVPENYEEWLRHQYGDKIADKYPINYTFKYWDTPPADLSTSWIGNRMRRAQLDEILFGAFSSETPNTYYTKEMRYPISGGYKAFIQQLINDSDISLNKSAAKIKSRDKIVVFADGSEVCYGQLISSIPLPILPSLMDNTPLDVMEAAAKLEATSIDLISVGFDCELDLDLWIYIYDRDILASRAYSPSVKSKLNAPDGRSSLQFEIYQRGRSSKHSALEEQENTVYAIEKLGLASKSNILFTHHKHLPWGNVIFDVGMEINREIVRNYIKNSQIKSCGRFGEWDYLWSNQSFLSGYNAFSS